MKKLLMILTLFFLYGLGYAQPTVIYFTSAGLHKTTLTPTTLTTGTLLDATNMSYQTMEYANGIVYAVSRPAWPAISAFGTIDKNTGAFTVIKEDIGYNVSGLAWNPLDNTMYAVYQTASATSRGFGKINLTTGDFEEIGATWAVNAMQLQASIVIDNDGICYFLDYGQNASMRFGTLNLTTGAQTAILTNINAQNRLTDMSIDRETDVMYVSTPGANTVNSLSTITKAGARTTYGSPTTSQRWQAFAIFTEEPSSTTDYTVNIATPTNGSITVMNGSTPVTDGTQLPEGTTLTLTATPATGYEFDQWCDGNTPTPRTSTWTIDT
ncbi:MAG: hypothetical protein LBH22_01295, partial [Bacteroidales bacterium]|nr:hypothetical protein [Bacteroidales bacterium]